MESAANRLQKEAKGYLDSLRGRRRRRRRRRRRDPTAYGILTLP
jgi:hypothetical protein